MPIKNKDLHGNVPEKSAVALLIIDVITDFEFPDGDKLLVNAEPIAENIARLREKAEKSDIPVIYVNDNFGKWQSDFTRLLRHCAGKSARGRHIVNLLKPKARDYFVLKPKHSGFYSTTLEILLTYLGVETLIFAGWTADICVLFTANDAYLRDYNLFIPRDCVASVDKQQNEDALKFVARVLDADTRPADELNLSKKSVK